MDLSQAVQEGDNALLPISDSRLSHLQTILHSELQALTSTSPQLNLARSLQHKQHHQQQQQQPEAIPLLGSFLLQLVAKDEDHPGSHLELVQSLLQCSTFARALHSELQSLRSTASSSYSSIKQTLTAVGQYLPPAADSANNSPTNSVGNSSHYYGQGLNLGQLQHQADESSLALINLEDAVTSSAASLANLAQQYDITLTAALARAERLADPVSPTAAARENGEVQYGFFTPGVCSHSAKKQMYKFTAGVAADAYNSSLHKLLTHCSSVECVLWMLSVIYARLRFAADTAAEVAALAKAEQNSVRMSDAGSKKSWVAPDQFTRNTTKYWVHPSNLLRLKVALTKQLPLLVYGEDDPVSSGDIAAAAAKDGQQQQVSSLVSSVYFDNPDLSVYHTRLAKEDGAKLVRVRWYGQKQTGEGAGEQAMFVEQKTHRDFKQSGERSTKERGNLQQSQLAAFLTGQLSAEEAVKSSRKAELLCQVQNFLISTQQVPALRSEYLRSAWQAYDNNEVRLSLDEHMLLLREARPTHNSSSTNSPWCSPLEDAEQLPACDAVRFPYGILEIKLQDKDGAPGWVQELLRSSVLVEAPRFSKFIHGMALLQYSKVQEAPSWFLSKEGGMPMPASIEEMWEMTAEKRAEKLEYTQVQRTGLRSSSLSTPGSMMMLLEAPHLYRASNSPFVSATDNTTWAAGVGVRLIPRVQSKLSSASSGTWALSYTSKMSATSKLSGSNWVPASPPPSPGTSPFTAAVADGGPDCPPHAARLACDSRKLCDARCNTLRNSRKQTDTVIDIKPLAQQSKSFELSLAALPLGGAAALQQQKPAKTQQQGYARSASIAEAGGEREDSESKIAAPAVKSSGSRGSRYKQRVQQWKAAVSRKVKAARGKGSDQGKSGPSNSSGTNEHTAGFAPGSFTGRPASVVKPRSDPKTFFANERTFLQWLQISVLVMMTGMGMLVGSNLIPEGTDCAHNAICSASMVSGAIITPISILFMIYALYLYIKRTKQLLSRSTMRYDDERGPWVLTVLLIMATLLVTILAIHAYRTGLLSSSSSKGSNGGGALAG